MLAAHQKHQGIATVLTIRQEKELAQRYGCVVASPETSEVLHFVEKPGGFFFQFKKTMFTIFFDINKSHIHNK